MRGPPSTTRSTSRRRHAEPPRDLSRTASCSPCSRCRFAFVATRSESGAGSSFKSGVIALGLLGLAGYCSGAGRGFGLRVTPKKWLAPVDSPASRWAQCSNRETSSQVVQLREGPYAADTTARSRMGGVDPRRRIDGGMRTRRYLSGALMRLSCWNAFGPAASGRRRHQAGAEPSGDAGEERAMKHPSLGHSHRGRARADDRGVRAAVLPRRRRTPWPRPRPRQLVCNVCLESGSDVDTDTATESPRHRPPRHRSPCPAGASPRWRSSLASRTG